MEGGPLGDFLWLFYWGFGILSVCYSGFCSGK